MKKKFNFKPILIGALILCVLSVSFVVPSFAYSHYTTISDVGSGSLAVQQNWDNVYTFNLSSDGLYTFTFSTGSYLPLYNDSIEIHSPFTFSRVDGLYYSDYFDGVNSFSLVFLHDPSIESEVDQNYRYYLSVQPLPSPTPTPPPTPTPVPPTPTPPPDVWDSTSEFTGGFFGGATSIFNALFGSPVFALLVIGLPLAGIIIGFVLKVVFLKKKR